MRTALATLGQMILAGVLAAAVAVVALIAIARVEWPAFPSSNQLHALTTVGQVGCFVGLLGGGWLWRRGWQRLARLTAVVFVSAFSVVTLAMPLGATKLYLFGISVDQQFRTEYLTRFADSPALRDMTYFGLPPFYPPGWFWLGGRAAALTGIDAWAMYKPWAIVSIAVAVAATLVLWQAMIRFEYALLVTVAGTAVTLAYGSPEPYAAMITVALPPVLVLAWSGLRAGARERLPTPPSVKLGSPSVVDGEPSFTAGGWGAVAGTGIFLGFAATFYSLLAGYSAFTVTAMALLLAAARRCWGPLGRLAVIGVIAAAIASLTWLPYLLRAAREPTSNTGSARHYLPPDGAELSFPMLQFTLLGALCLLGTGWLVVRARSSVRAGALAIGVVAVYLWSLLSMLATLARTTLLSFRLQPTLAVLLATAGAFGFVEVTLALRRRSGAIVPAAAALGLAGAIAFSQDIPDVLRPDLTVAYTDTDGHGERGDRRPPGAEKYYAAIDAAIIRATEQPRDQTVVLTADYSFLSYYPYWGFQGLTSHYANPLAQFDQRREAIESWSQLKSAEQFGHALDTLPWRAPTVFILRRGAGDTYTLRLAKDVYPNHPNVRRYVVEFDAALFDDLHFRVEKIGPFVVAIRLR